MIYKVAFTLFLIWVSANTFSQSNPGFLIKDDCNLRLEKFINRTLYINSDIVPDQLNVFLDNVLILFRRTGKIIKIPLPLYIDGIENSSIRIFATRNHMHCNDLIISLRYGKPIDSKEAISAIVRSEDNKVIHEKRDAIIIEHTQKVKVDEKKDTLTTSEKDFKMENMTSPLPGWISIYADAYYAFYNDSVGINQYQQFPSISPKSNSFGLNTVQINFQYENERIRGAASFHYGDYAKTNWSTNFNNIMEARVGFRLFKKLWVDAGFFRTFIGTEGLLPRENICSSTAIATFYEPAYVSGVRVNYIPTEKWNLQFYVVNAYNGFEDNNNKKSFGSLITYTINDQGNVGISNYLGDDTPGDADSISHLRFYQNVFFNYQFNKLKFQFGVDYCLQQNSRLENSNESANMLSGMATVSYSLTGMLSMYGRYEYFNDPDAILSSQILDSKGKSSGYKLWGLTSGVEVRPFENYFIRLEGRYLQMDSNQNIFYRDAGYKNSRSEIMLNMGITF